MGESSTDTRTHLKFSQDTYIPLWVDAFLVDRKAANFAPGTLYFYQKKLSVFLSFCESQAITQLDQLTAQNIREYLISLEASGHNEGGIHAFFRALRAFLRWYELEAEPEGWRNPITRIRTPKLSKAILEPANLLSVTKILATCAGRSVLDARDKAIILTLLDTGLRASELLNIAAADLDPIRGDIVIRQGKGRKPRTVFVGKRTRKAIRAYIRVRQSTDGALFVTDEGEKLTYAGLRMMVKRRAARAGVVAPTLHSFRRFFALSYLRNGGDIFTLQKLMGHADLQVLRRYLHQVDSDLQRGHQEHGPVDRMRTNEV